MHEIHVAAHHDGWIITRRFFGGSVHGGFSVIS
jgi:hypothetical protein